MAPDKRSAIVFITHAAGALVADYSDLIFLRVVKASDIQLPSSGRLEVQMPCMVKFQLASNCVKLVPAIIVELRNESVGEVYGELYGKEEVLLATAKRWEALHSKDKAKSLQPAQTLPRQQTNGFAVSGTPKARCAYRETSRKPAVANERTVSDDNELVSLDEEYLSVPKHPVSQATAPVSASTSPSLRGILLPARSRLSPTPKPVWSDEDTDADHSSHARSDSPEWSPPPVSSWKQTKRPHARTQSLSRSSTPVSKKFKPATAVPSRAKSLAPPDRVSAPASNPDIDGCRTRPSSQIHMTLAEKTNSYYREQVPALISRAGGHDSVSSELLLSKMISNYTAVSRAGRMKRLWGSSLRYAVGKMFTRSDLLTYGVNPFGVIAGRESKAPGDLATQHHTRLRQIFALVGKTCEKKNCPKPDHDGLMDVMKTVVTQLKRKTSDRT